MEDPEVVNAVTMIRNGIFQVLFPSQIFTENVGCLSNHHHFGNRLVHLPRQKGHGGSQVGAINLGEEHLDDGRRQVLFS